jgi:hypothetical protein
VRSRWEEETGEEGVLAIAGMEEDALEGDADGERHRGGWDGG